MHLEVNLVFRTMVPNGPRPSLSSFVWRVRSVTFETTFEADVDSEFEDKSRFLAMVASTSEVLLSVAITIVHQWYVHQGPHFSLSSGSTESRGSRGSRSCQNLFLLLYGQEDSAP